MANGVRLQAGPRRTEHRAQMQRELKMVTVYDYRKSTARMSGWRRRIRRGELDTSGTGISQKRRCRSRRVSKRKPRLWRSRWNSSKKRTACSLKQAGYGASFRQGSKERERQGCFECGDRDHRIRECPNRKK